MNAATACLACRSQALPRWRMDRARCLDPESVAARDRRRPWRLRQIHDRQRHHMGRQVLSEKWLPIAGLSVVLMLHAGVIAGWLHIPHARRSTNGAPPIFVGFVVDVPRLAQRAAPPARAARPQHRDRHAERSPRNSKAEMIRAPGPVEPSRAPPLPGPAPHPQASLQLNRPMSLGGRPAGTAPPCRAGARRGGSDGDAVGLVRFVP